MLSVSLVRRDYLADISNSNARVPCEQLDCCCSASASYEYWLWHDDGWCWASTRAFLVLNSTPVTGNELHGIRRDRGFQLSPFRLLLRRISVIPLAYTISICGLPQTKNCLLVPCFFLFSSPPSLINMTPGKPRGVVWLSFQPALGREFSGRAQMARVNRHP